jgi:hypothetical protein
VFRGKNVPSGQKSMAYSFTYRSAEKTLTDAEGERRARENRRATQTRIAGDRTGVKSRSILLANNESMNASRMLAARLHELLQPRIFTELFH